MGQASGRAIDADLAQSDPDIAAFVNQERQRQETHLELIASENFASRAVMQAQGSVLTNKYAEGLPSKRYYGGCEHVDAIEELAIERAKQLFGAAWANVQPHSGAQANFAVFLALLQPGDTIMGWICPMAATSPMVPRSTSAASGSTSSSTASTRRPNALIWRRSASWLWSTSRS